MPPASARGGGGSKGKRRPSQRPPPQGPNETAWPAREADEVVQPRPDTASTEWRKAVCAQARDDSSPAALPRPRPGRRRGPSGAAVERGETKPSDNPVPGAGPSQSPTTSERAVDRKEPPKLRRQLGRGGHRLRSGRFKGPEDAGSHLPNGPRPRPASGSSTGSRSTTLGRWKPALPGSWGAFAALSDSTEQHPVLADAYRALGRYD